MWVPLKLGASAPNEQPGAVDLLLECHVRIRRHCALAVALATAPAARAGELPAAAEQLVRYFGTALPLHVADEDLSLAPLLRELPALAPVLRELKHQHDRLDRELGALVPAWQAIARGHLGEPLALEAASNALTAAFEEHLALEERELFPAARAHLTPELDARLVGEFRQRRAMPAAG